MSDHYMHYTIIFETKQPAKQIFLQIILKHYIHFTNNY